MLKAYVGHMKAVCRLWMSVVCVVLLCFSMNIVGSVSTTFLHSPVPLIQYASTILKLLRPNNHEFAPSPPSPPPNVFFQRRRRGKKGVKAKHDKRLYRPFIHSWGKGGGGGGGASVVSERLTKAKVDIGGGGGGGSLQSSYQP